MRPYIDIHTHLGTTINRDPVCGQSATKILARASQSGVVAAVPSAAPGGPQARGVIDTRDQNALVAKACRDFPDRFPIGLGVVEVRHLDPGVHELARSMDDDGLVGFMIHPGISGHAMRGELHPFLEAVESRRGLVMLHVGDRYIAASEALARRFSGVNFVMLHVGSNEVGHGHAVEAFAPLDNVWVDIAQHPAPDELSWGIAAIVRDFPADRVMFGSDAPYYDYRVIQSAIERAPISDEAKDCVAWRNAADLIRKYAPGWNPPTGCPATPAEWSDVSLWETLPGQPLRLR